MAVMTDLSLTLGLRPDYSGRALTAVALMKTGVPLESISSMLSWREFEEFCADLLSASGYKVKTNVVLTKPRRQVDIFAESIDLALCVDCKHWNKSFSPYALEKIATDQLERTRLYKKKRSVETPTLPAIFSMLDAPARLVRGVPIVPVFALRDFLNSVNRFEPGFAIV